MKMVFADSGYWIALFDPRDRLHGRAQQLEPLIHEAKLVTSQLVLTEVLNFFSNSGSNIRKSIAALPPEIDEDPKCDLIPMSSEQFKSALQLYRQRPDKSWSLTDCASMLIMRSSGIQDILTEDRHFEQAGFNALLRHAS